MGHAQGRVTWFKNKTLDFVVTKIPVTRFNVLKFLNLNLFHHHWKKTGKLSKDQTVKTGWWKCAGCRGEAGDQVVQWPRWQVLAIARNKNHVFYFKKNMKKRLQTYRIWQHILCKKEVKHREFNGNSQNHIVDDSYYVSMVYALGSLLLI